MQYLNVGIGNMFPDDALQKSEGGMKEYEKNSFGIFPPWIYRMRFWTDYSGDIIYDFAPAGTDTGIVSQSGLSGDIFTICTCVYCRRHERHLSDGTDSTDGGDSDSWWSVICQLSGHISDERMAGMGDDSDFSIFSYFCFWLSDNLGNYLRYNQEENGKDQ